MTCRSQMAGAVRELTTNAGRAMGTIQSSVVSFYEAHQITKFLMYAMSTGLVAAWYGRPQVSMHGSQR